MVDNTLPVPVSVSRTSAPGTAAPCSSVTIPVIELFDVACEKASGALQTVRIARQHTASLSEFKKKP
jgi:hypothetical protein